MKYVKIRASAQFKVTLSLCRHELCRLSPPPSALNGILLVQHLFPQGIIIMVKVSNFINKTAEMEEFRKKWSIPSTVSIRKGLEEADESWMEFPEVAISKCGIRFPLPRLLRELLRKLHLHPCQLSDNSLRIIGGILKLNEMEGIHIGVWEILYCYEVVQQSKGKYYLRGRHRYNIIQCLPVSEKSENTWRVSLFVRGDWEFPRDEVNPARCPRRRRRVAKIPHWKDLKAKINLGGLFDRKLDGIAAGVYWRSYPLLLGYPSNDYTILPVGVSSRAARQFFNSKKFASLMQNRERHGQALNDVSEEHTLPATEGSLGGSREEVDDNTIEEIETQGEEEEVEVEEEEELSMENSENNTPAPTDGSTEEVDPKSMEEEEGKDAYSKANSEKDLPQTSSRELDYMDDIPSPGAEGHETGIASEFDYSMDDIPSLGIEGHVLPSIFISDAALVPPRHNDIPECSSKRKTFGHLKDESTCKKVKELHNERGKEKINCMAPDDIVNCLKVFAEKIGEGYISATEEVTRLNALVENLERRTSTAENKLLAVESFSQGYQSEIRELEEKLKLLEARSKEEKKQARAEAIEQCHEKYTKEVAVIVNHHYGHGWCGALMAANVEEASTLWNSDSIPWPNKGVEFPRPDIRRLSKSDAFSNGPSCKVTSRF